MGNEKPSTSDEGTSSEGTSSEGTSSEGAKGDVDDDMVANESKDENGARTELKDVDNSMDEA